MREGPLADAHGPVPGGWVWGCAIAALLILPLRIGIPIFRAEGELSIAIRRRQVLQAGIPFGLPRDLRVAPPGGEGQGR